MPAKHTKLTISDNMGILPFGTLPTGDVPLALCYLMTWLRTLRRTHFCEFKGKLLWICLQTIALNLILANHWFPAKLVHLLSEG